MKPQPCRLSVQAAHDQACAPRGVPCMSLSSPAQHLRACWSTRWQVAWRARVLNEGPQPIVGDFNQSVDRSWLMTDVLGPSGHQWVCSAAASAFQRETWSKQPLFSCRYLLLKSTLRVRYQFLCQGDNTYEYILPLLVQRCILQATLGRCAAMVVPALALKTTSIGFQDQPPNDLGDARVPKL